MKKIRFGSWTVLAVVVLLAACSPKSVAPTKYLVMGTNAEFPPFDVRGGENSDKVVGFDVDVAQAIAAKVGLPLKIEDMKFDDLLPALSAGKVDMVLAALAITPERAQTVDFSEPYYKATQVALVIAGSPFPQTKEDLNGYKVGVQLGSIGAGVVGEIVDSERTRQYPSAKDAVVDLMNSQVEVVVLDEQPAREFLKKNPELILVSLGCDDEFYGVAVQKGNAELLAKVNEALTEMQADGRVDQFIDQWMVQMVGTTAESTEADAEATE